MARYQIAYEVDMGCYPNYSLAMADLDGDGRREIVVADQSGDHLRAVDLDNSVLFERDLHNNGNWGTLPLCCADLDGDGREEIVVPETVRGSRPGIVVLDASGEQVAFGELPEARRDDFGLFIPLLSRFRRSASGAIGILAALAGGVLLALDDRMREIWRVGGLRNDFGHDLFVSDVDGDGADEAYFCTVDSINTCYKAGGNNVGDLVLLDHDGSLLLRTRVDRYYPDTHFDEMRIQDYTGDGTSQILIEKGILLDLEGRILWDRSADFCHGQWIADAPVAGGRGRTIMISELWAPEVRAVLLSGDGRLLRELKGMTSTFGRDRERAGWRLVSTRCHALEWRPGAGFEFFMAEQALSPTSHDCFETVGFEPRCYFYDTRGDLLRTMPFADAQVKGSWYNGEVRSWTGDMDGDGDNEIAFPRQNGTLMVLKKTDAP